MQTALEEKKRVVKEFYGHVEHEIVSGSEKYALSADKEATDFILDMLPGKTGTDPVLADIIRYMIRFINQGVERDLFKAGAYLPIAWAKKFGNRNDQAATIRKPRRTRKTHARKTVTGGSDVPALGAGEGNAGVPAKAE